MLDVGRCSVALTIAHRLYRRRRRSEPDRCVAGVAVVNDKGIFLKLLRMPGVPKPPVCPLEPQNDGHHAVRKSGRVFLTHCHKRLTFSKHLHLRVGWILSFTKTRLLAQEHFWKKM